MAEYETGSIGSSEEPGSDPQKPQDEASVRAQWNDYWVKELAAAKRWMRDFHALGNRIEDRYLGLKNSGSMGSADDGGSANFNVFWSNIQVILSAIFARPPKPEINRAHLDPADDVARVAATILRRIFEAQFTLPDTSPLLSLKDAVQDRFVPGLGMVWVRYNMETEKIPIEGVPPSPDGQQPMQEVITDEQAPLDYVRWDDFIMSPCRRWSEARWVGRRHYFAREELRQRWPQWADTIPLTGRATRRNSGDQRDPIMMAPRDQATIYEIWDKEHRRVFWKAEGFETLLDIKGDVLQLRGFYPCPPPLLATHGTRSMLPTPDFMMVRSQYNELEMLATRMILLSEAIRVVGVYDKTSVELNRILGQTVINQMIPVDNWAMFAEKGGVKGAVDWFPLDMVVAALEKLTARKAAVLNELYEIMGISDLMRGMSVASETATAQKLKAQFGGARVAHTQSELNSFVTSAMWLMLEVVARHWQPETIAKVSQIEQTPDKQFAQPAIQLIKQSPDLIYRISVSTDSMSSPDWNEEKQQRTEFLQAISQFIGMSMPLIQMDKGSAVFLIQILQWAATGFKAGSQIESVLDQALTSMQQNLMKPPPPPTPSPEDLERISKTDQNIADAAATRVEAAAKAKEAGLPIQLAIVPSPISMQVTAGINALAAKMQGGGNQPGGGRPSLPPPGQGGSPPGPPPAPPGAPTQAGPIPLMRPQ
jgi:hypothetical protein